MQIKKTDVDSTFKHLLACWTCSVMAFQCLESGISVSQQFAFSAKPIPLYQAREDKEIMTSFLSQPRPQFLPSQIQRKNSYKHVILAVYINKAINQKGKYQKCQQTGHSSSRLCVYTLKYNLRFFQRLFLRYGQFFLFCFCLFICTSRPSLLWPSYVLFWKIFTCFSLIYWARKSEPLGIPLLVCCFRLPASGSFQNHITVRKTPINLFPPSSKSVEILLLEPDLKKIYTYDL